MNNAENVGATLGWLVASCKIEKPVPAAVVKVAAAAGTDIRESPISGKGLFATRPATSGDVLITAYMQKQTTDDPRTRWEQSESCRYTNHSNNANAFIRKVGDRTDLIADETIQPNEEITVNYKDATRTLGTNFFYTYQGKPYGNGIEVEEFYKKIAATMPVTFYGLVTYRTPPADGVELAMDIAGFTRPAERLTKVAMDAIGAGLIGAGVGGLSGGVINWLRADKGKRRNAALAGVLGGAALGGAVGAGGHMLYNGARVQPSNTEAPGATSTDKDKPTTATSHGDGGLKARGLYTGGKSYPEVDTEEWFNLSKSPMLRPAAATSTPSVSYGELLPRDYKEDAIRYAEQYRYDNPRSFDSHRWLQTVSPGVINRKVPLGDVSDKFISRYDRRTDTFDKNVKDKSKHVFDMMAATQSFDPHVEDSSLQLQDKHSDLIGKIYTQHNMKKYPSSGYSESDGALKSLVAKRFPQDIEQSLAHIKQKYFEHTGRHVVDEQDANRALNWYLNEVPAEIGDTGLPVNAFYNSLLRNAEDTPEKYNWLDILSQIMPGLVKSDKPAGNRTKYADYIPPAMPPGMGMGMAKIEARRLRRNQMLAGPPLLATRADSLKKPRPKMNPLKMQNNLPVGVDWKVVLTQYPKQLAKGYKLMTAEDNDDDSTRTGT